MINASAPSLLVTGAAGQLGRLTVERLLTSGVSNIVAGSRDPSKLGSLADRGVEVRKVDFDDLSSLAVAFNGIHRALIVSTDAIMVPDLRLRQHLAAVNAAVRAGVEHIAYTSLPNAGPESPVPFAPDHRETERAIAESGVAFTFLRNNFYMENTFFMARALASGRVFSSAGSGRSSHVSRADAASVAAAVLASGIPGAYDVTGPSSHTIDELVAALARAVEHPVEVVHVSDDELGQGMIEAGLPPAMAAALVSMDVATRRGLQGTVTDAVRALTGHPAVSLAEFLAVSTHRAALVRPSQH
ncbi:NAD(P)H-binding protein [Lichenicoccus roseus]|uniref:KR domain-containing protein n=1 Tax=Lichenicoccus roseus TaxID=2683649 RepID=A0A5R9IZ29_9PROT|nr:NAD(P)H-binding protein [Lichenicoccus roseus]TLU70744.1 KR domain-containing protein [Lichenicoccus roseus]